MSTLRISQPAERSGVPASTLRFYETAGLLPAERTSSGYRQYGPDAVERLAFISSAKLLGLALEDIRDLLDVRDAGVCAAVRARIVPLVADRIADADRRSAELVAFSARLAEVRRQLSGPAPSGGCGPDCGCTTAEEQPPAPGPVMAALSTRPRRAADEPWREARWPARSAGPSSAGPRSAGAPPGGRPSWRGPPAVQRSPTESAWPSPALRSWPPNSPPWRRPSRTAVRSSTSP
ncbi:heavy metal-responsive transcriptional regulator [Streptomyces nojiriensis]|nr:heavy metal-responsive transcriptional regulator [Streptomyces nojiriensis]QTI49471.1 Mercuric resistance operon regulatory protein [Streptomyces nojiriensis]